MYFSLWWFTEEYRCRRGRIHIYSLKSDLKVIIRAIKTSLGQGGSFVAVLLCLNVIVIVPFCVVIALSLFILSVPRKVYAS